MIEFAQICVDSFNAECVMRMGSSTIMRVYWQPTSAERFALVLRVLFEDNNISIVMFVEYCIITL